MQTRIRSAFAALLLATFMFSMASAQDKPVAEVSVEQVIELHRAGLSEGILLTRIKQANKPLQLSTDELLKLSEAKVPEPVIQALMDPSISATAPPASVASAVTTPTVVIGPDGTPVIAPIGTGLSRASGATTDDRTAAGDPNDPMSPHDSGIYLYADKKSGAEMILLEPAAYTGAKSGGFLNRNISSLFSAKTRAIIQGNRASIRAIDRQPVFYFYFEDRAAGLGKPNIFGGVTSPNQFVLVKLEDKKTTRETVISSDSALGASVGTDQKAMVPFTSERLKTGLYKVTFAQDLKTGEYAFMVSAGIGGPQQAGAAAPIQIFDFGVPVE